MLAGALALAGAVPVVLWYFGWWSTTTRIPEIDLVGVDPEVAEDIRQARDKVKREPKSGAAWGQLGAKFHAYRFHRQALTCYAQAEQLDPRSADWPYLSAVIHLAGPEPAEAIPLLQRAAERAARDHDHPLPRIRLGEVLLEQGRFEEAAEQFQLVLATWPEEPRAHLRLAQIRAERQQWQECLRHLEKAASSPAPRVSPARKHICALRLRAFEGLGDRVAAQTQRRLLAELPEDPPWPDEMVAQLVRAEAGVKARVQNAQEIMRSGQLDEAARLLQETVEKYPDSAQAWDKLGRVLAVLGSFAEAERALNRSLELAPQTGDVWSFLGQMRLEQKKFDEALSAFRKAAELKPADPQMHCLIGTCLAGKGDREGAARAYREALRFQPDHPEALAQLAKLTRLRRPSAP
jgi:cytochrome c-type biogenesis protein CcmH/NrfG